MDFPYTWTDKPNTVNIATLPKPIQCNLYPNSNNVLCSFREWGWGLKIHIEAKTQRAKEILSKEYYGGTTIPDFKLTTEPQ